MSKNTMVYKGGSKFRSNNKDLESWAKKGYFPKTVGKEDKKVIEEKLKEEGKGLKEVKKEEGSTKHKSSK